MESSKKHKQKEQVQSFLELSSKQVIPKDGFVVLAEDLRSLFTGDKEVQDIINDAAYAWTAAEMPRKYLFNCGCGLKLRTYGYLREHLSVCELVQVPSNLERLFSENFQYPLPEEWERKLSGCRWEPIDVHAADLKMTEIVDWNDASLQSKDLDRILCLKNIGKLLQSLVSKKLLDIRVLNLLIDMAMCGVEKLPFGELLKKKGVDKSTNLCLRFIGARRLKVLLNFLQNLCKACSVLEYEKMQPSFYEDDIIFHHQEIKWSFLDPRPFTISTYHWFDDEAQVDTEGIISWLYEGPATQDAIQSWVKSKEVRNNLFHLILDKFNLKLNRLSRHLKDRDGFNRYDDVLRKLERNWKTKKIESDNPTKCLLYVLTGWKKYLTKSQKEEDIACINAINKDFFEVAAEDSWNTVKVIGKARIKCGEKLSVLDMKILKKMAYIRKLLDNFEFVSGIDYLAATVPLVKMFIQEELGRKAEEFARTSTGGMLGEED